MTEIMQGLDTLEGPNIPWDKSWTIRMGAQDLFGGHSDTLEFLDDQKRLSDDLRALKAASEAWPGSDPVPVYESATLYRVLLFASWKFGLDKEFITGGTLSDRPITRDPSIVSLRQEDLLKLDHETSQWASAAVLAGDPERLDPSKFDLADKYHKLGLTYLAVDHWQSQRRAGHMWVPQRDMTIARQAHAFQQMLKDEPAGFTPLQAEDYCFAVTFGYITPAEGESRWPSLVGHESNRLSEMAIALDQAAGGELVGSRDHRVVQAVAMWGRLMGQEVSLEHPEAVNKSWPEFWDFIVETA